MKEGEVEKEDQAEAKYGDYEEIKEETKKEDSVHEENENLQNSSEAEVQPGEAIEEPTEEKTEEQIEKPPSESPEELPKPEDNESEGNEDETSSF